MVRVGRDLCGSSSPTRLPKQDHLQQAAEDLVHVGLEYLQRRRLHNLPGDIIQPIFVIKYNQYLLLNTEKHLITLPCRFS